MNEFNTDYKKTRTTVASIKNQIKNKNIRRDESMPNNIKPLYVDDKFDHLVSDVDKIRNKYRQYISFSNEQGAHAVVLEILFNALDECKTPRSPADKVLVYFDERDGFIEVIDNGRGIPLDLLEEVYTSLNMGSNIDTTNKSNMKVATLGQNGTGTLAICGLAEHVEITSYRGGTENKFKKLIFEEGVKVSEEDGKCSVDKHGMDIRFKPSKVMGKNTRIIWDPVKKELENQQYLIKNKLTIKSFYTDKNGKETQEVYKISPFVDILNRNDKDTMISQKIMITIDEDNIFEELDGESVKRFLSMDVAFVFTNSLAPYIDSFSNSNNTVDNGDHLDGSIEAISRYFQVATRNMMSDREKNSLDIKWDDVRQGLSIVVALRTNYERLYTGQTKHKIVNSDIRKIISNLLSDALDKYFTKNPNQLKDLCGIVKMNAKARREGEKVRTAVVKNTLTNWSSYKMKNYDPCTNKGIREYKELYICEGLSAGGSLKQSRDPKFQAIYSVRGVGLNVFKCSMDQIIGPNGNKEFTDLASIMGCNVGPKFDLSKLQFNKIIIASDADVDGGFITSILCAFFYKVFPEIVKDGRLYKSIPPLYRVEDKKNPFVVDKGDYIKRYVKSASKDYKLGYEDKNEIITYLDNDQWKEFLSDTSSYADDMLLMVNHFVVNGRLLEMIIEEFAMINFNEESFEKIPDIIANDIVKAVNIKHLIDRVVLEFPEIYYDEKDNLIKGVIDGKYQMLEINTLLVKKTKDLIKLIRKWGPKANESMILKDIKTATEHKLSLLGILKILKKYQPAILHRFKGLILGLIDLIAGSSLELT